MSKGRLCLASALISLFACLVLIEPAIAHEGKRGTHNMGKFKSKDSSAKESCSLESPHSWLGLMVQDLSQNRSVAQDVEAGALVIQVIKGGPAEAVGVKQGDIIVTFNDQPVTGARQLSGLVAELPAGSEARLILISNGKQQSKTLTLTEPKFAFKQKPGKSTPQLYPGMFMEDMMERSPLGQMREVRRGPGRRFSPPSPEQTLSEQTLSEQTLSGQIVIKQQEQNYIGLYLRHQDMLGLSPEQVTKLEHLAREQRKLRIRTNAEIQIAEIELQELLNEGEVDLGKVEEKIKQLEADRGKKLLSQVKTLQQAKGLLTDEQRAKLKELQLN